jgi:hypothetical protein
MTTMGGTSNQSGGDRQGVGEVNGRDHMRQRHAGPVGRRASRSGWLV